MCVKASVKKCLYISSISGEKGGVIFEHSKIKLDESLWNYGSKNDFCELLGYCISFGFEWLALTLLSFGVLLQLVV